MTLPALFLSHGAPTLLLDDSPARAFLAELGGRLARPRAVLAVSGHWEEAEPGFSGATDTIHDFWGFPEPLYRMAYAAPAAPDLVAEAGAALAAAGFRWTMRPDRGRDHGTWVPLALMYPAADIPVVQLSLLDGAGPDAHLRLGDALRPLRESGVLVVGSGGFTHNLRDLDWRNPDAPEAGWVTEFCDWMHAALIEGRVAELAAYRSLCPHGARSHPTEDHILPLFVALGAGGTGAAAERLHASLQFGALRLDAYAFG